MFQPTQLDLVSRHLFDISLGFYANRSFIVTHDMPASLEEIFSHRILGFDRDQQMVDGGRAMGLQLTNEQFQFRCDFMPLQIALCVNGGGIAVTHESIAQAHDLVNVCPDIKLPDLPVYLVCHRDVQHNRAIRVMMGFLGSNLSS